MSLIALKNYMSEVKIASLGGLCERFNSPPEMMQCLLRHWVSKGKIRACQKTPACRQQCFKCSTLVTELYEWVF